MTPGELLRLQLDGNLIGVVTVVLIVLMCALFTGWD